MGWGSVLDKTDHPSSLFSKAQSPTEAGAHRFSWVVCPSNSWESPASVFPVMGSQPSPPFYMAAGKMNAGFL